MNITQIKVTIRELTEGYYNDDEEGVVGYNGQLDIRPKYQREFVYEEGPRNEVIKTVMRHLPLNVIYWVDRGADHQGEPRYEVLDGQQRTISICEYVKGFFSVNDKFFENLQPDQQQAILNYELFVYVCDGTDSEKLEWFKIINIAGKTLTDQERRNAVYAGSWVSDAKRYFSKSKCPANSIGGSYLTGSSIRQEYLETAIKWIASKEGISIEAYMAKHANDQNAVALWNYFRNVIEWVEAVFKVKRKQMKGRPWGLLYNEHGTRTDLNADAIEKRISELLADDDVTNASGVYEYILTGDERKLQIRQFDNRDRIAAYEKQKHKCKRCGKVCKLEEMHADHIMPWSKGGHTTRDNCQMLCRDCNLWKSDL